MNDWHELEATLLGACTYGTHHFDAAKAVGVTGESFTEPAHQALWMALESILGAGVTLDEGVTRLSRETRSTLFSVQALTAGGLNTEALATELVSYQWQLRAAEKLRLVAASALRREPWQPIEPVRAQLSSVLSELLDGEVSDHLATLEPGALADQFEAEFEAAAARVASGQSVGITTGLDVLDRLTGGWQPATFNVLGARTSCGKTTLAINFAVAAAETKAQVCYFTIEMRSPRILGKIISRIGGINSRRISTATASEAERDAIADATRKYRSMGLRVNDKAGRAIEQIEAEASRLRRRGRLDFLIVDYVQQLSCHSQRFSSRQSELTEITARLQRLAQTLGVPVLVLAQLNRQAELQPDRPPVKSMLKDSGSIEQDADTILLIHRQDTHDPRGGTSLVLDKNRDGETMRFEVGVDFTVSRFHDVQKSVYANGTPRPA